MTMLEALRLCQSGHRVRPVCWREQFRHRWVTTRDSPHGTVFVVSQPYDEKGERRFTAWLILATEDEFLGEWEVVE